MINMSRNRGSKKEKKIMKTENKKMNVNEEETKKRKNRPVFDGEKTSFIFSTISTIVYLVITAVVFFIFPDSESILFAIIQAVILIAAFLGYIFINKLIFKRNIKKHGEEERKTETEECAAEDDKV